jgi:hypothetical protein
MTLRGIRSNCGSRRLRILRARLQSSSGLFLDFSWVAADGYIRSWLRSTRIHLDLKALVEEGDHNEVATDLFLPDGVICEWLRTRIEYPTQPRAGTKS